MASKLPTVKITDLVTTLDVEIFDSVAGPMVWSAVDITYACDGLAPQVVIKVPVPVLPAQNDAQRRAEALRRARKLIDHACAAMEPEPEGSQDIREVMEGLAEELGVLAPTNRPRHARP